MKYHLVVIASVDIVFSCIKNLAQSKVSSLLHNYLITYTFHCMNAYNFLNEMKVADHDELKAAYHYLGFGYIFSIEKSCL